MQRKIIAETAYGAGKSWTRIAVEIAEGDCDYEVTVGPIKHTFSKSPIPEIALGCALNFAISAVRSRAGIHVGRKVADELRRKINDKT
jgi:hypothetical protein